MHKWLLFGCFLAWGGLLQAGETKDSILHLTGSLLKEEPLTSEGLSLEFLLNQISRNPSLRAKEAEKRAAESSVLTAGVLPEPEIEFKLERKAEKIKLSQELTPPARRDLQRKIARSQASQYAHNLQTYRHRYQKELKQLFYQYYLLGQKKQILEKILLLEEAWLHLLKPCDTPKTEDEERLLKLEIEIARLEDEKLSLQHWRPVLSQKMNHLLGQDSQGLLPWPAKELSIPQTLSPIDRNYQNHPALKSMESMLEGRRREIDLAGTERKFVPEFGLEMTQRDGLLDLANQGENAFSLQWKTSLPVKKSRYRALEVEAKTLYEAKIHEKKELELDFIHRLHKADYERTEAHRKYWLNQSRLIPKLEKMIQTQKSMYAKGGLDFSEFIDNIRLLLKLRLEQEEALSQYYQSTAEIEEIGQN